MTILELACFNLESALLAQLAGADRIELCDNYSEGGTTPSKGTIEQAVEKLHIPFFVMIRPRGGNFIYNDIAFETIKKDIDFCKELGVKGIVLGLLTAQNKIDVDRTNILLERAGGMQITFHKAFDEIVDLEEALETLIKLKIQRVLTSGGKKSAIEGGFMIKKLQEQAMGRIQILAGGGVRSNNVKELIIKTGITEVHSAAIINKTDFFPQPDPNEIKAIKSLL